MNNFVHYWDYFLNLLATYTPKLILAVLTLILGLWLIRKFVKITDKIMARRNVDKSLHGFFKSLISIGLKILLLISVISMAGIETTSFVAILASAGFAIGMALQGSLSNFAGGILILIFKPFKVSDYIQAQAFEGTVQTIQIFYTVLLTADNKKIIIPNGTLSNGSIINHSAESTRRLDLSYSIGFKEDIEKVRNIIQKLVDADSRIFKDPAPVIAVNNLLQNSINLTVRVWCESAEYSNIQFSLNEQISAEFNKHSIELPHVQNDVYVAKSL